MYILCFVFFNTVIAFFVPVKNVRFLSLKMFQTNNSLEFGVGTVTTAKWKNVSNDYVWINWWRKTKITKLPGGNHGVVFVSMMPDGSENSCRHSFSLGTLMSSHISETCMLAFLKTLNFHSGVNVSHLEHPKAHNLVLSSLSLRYIYILPKVENKGCICRNILKSWCAICLFDWVDILGCVQT